MATVTSEVITGAIANAREELDHLESILPVATADQLDHLALDLRIIIAALTAAAEERRTRPMLRHSPQWWQ